NKGVRTLRKRSPETRTARRQSAIGGVGMLKYGGRRSVEATLPGTKSARSRKNKLSRRRAVPEMIAGAPFVFITAKFTSLRTIASAWRDKGTLVPRKANSKGGTAPFSQFQP